MRKNAQGHEVIMLSLYAMVRAIVVEKWKSSAWPRKVNAQPASAVGQSETLNHVCDGGRFRRKQPWRPVFNAATISAILGVGPFPCEPAHGRLSVQQRDI